MLIFNHLTAHVTARVDVESVGERKDKVLNLPYLRRDEIGRDEIKILSREHL